MGRVGSRGCGFARPLQSLYGRCGRERIERQIAPNAACRCVRRCGHRCRRQRADVRDSCRAAGAKVLVLEKGPKPGLKILVSGGGRCNFTNMWAEPTDHYLSANEHFCISAMRRYSPWDFIDMVNAHGIDYHEKKLGQLFCDHSAQDIVDMLLAEAAAAGVTLRLRHEVIGVQPIPNGYQLTISTGKKVRQARRKDGDTDRLCWPAAGCRYPKIASDLAFAQRTRCKWTSCRPVRHWSR